MENRVYCLYRVSTRKQADFNAENQADIPMQRKACREFAGQMGWQILYEGQETGVSGFKVSEKDRDVLQRIKEHALQRKFDILLVFMFDRIGRKADESPFVVEWFVRHGIRVWSVKEGEQRFDHHIDTLLNYIRFWQADGESRKTSVRTKEGLRQLVLDGGYRGGGVPYGYRLVATGRLNKRNKEISELAIDPDEAMVVRKIFDLCIVHGYGRCRIATELNRQGIRNRKGENWHEASIGHILHNPCYTGVLRSGDAVSQRFEHLMILPPELFEQAQALQKARQNEADEERTVPVNVTGNSLLSGNIYCGHCGGRLVLTSNCKSYVTADGNKVKHRRTRYVCYQKTRHRCVCDGQTGYTAHILDEKVEHVICRLLEQLGAVEERFLLQGYLLCEEKQLRWKIRDAAHEAERKKQDYQLLKQELQKSLHGSSPYPAEILAEMLCEAERNAASAVTYFTSLQSQLSLLRKKDMAQQDEKNIFWVDIYRASPIEVKKMIVCHLIPKIHVYRGYRLELEISDIGIAL